MIQETQKDEQVQGQVQSDGRAAVVPPGWYPDPIAGTGERYWDGIDWSSEFTRESPPKIERHAPIKKDYELECADFMPPSHHSRGGVASGLFLVALAALVIALKAWSLADTFLSLERVSNSFGPSVAGVFVLLLAILAVYKWGVRRYDD